MSREKNSKIKIVRTRSFQHERELARKLWKLGFAVVRGPASGAKAKNIVQPDLIAIKNRNIYIIEIKTSNKLRNIYVEDTQIEKITEFAKRSGGKPMIAVKIIGSGKWKFIDIEKLVKTGNRYRIDKDAIINGLTIKDIYKDASSDQKLDKFITSKTRSKYGS